MLAGNGTPIGSEDRIEATKERSAAYVDAGLGGRGEPEGPAPKTAGGGFLSGLFGSPTPATEPPDGWGYYSDDNIYSYRLRRSGARGD